jgi:hypothetical protein
MEFTIEDIDRGSITSWVKFKEKRVRKFFKSVKIPNAKLKLGNDTYRNITVSFVDICMKLSTGSTCFKSAGVTVDRLILA